MIKYEYYINNFFEGIREHESTKSILKNLLDQNFVNFKIEIHKNYFIVSRNSKNCFNHGKIKKEVFKIPMDNQFSIWKALVD